MTIKTILTAILFSAAYTAGAQTASWMIRPVMDSIELDEANKLLIGHRGDSTIVWTVEGKSIVQTTAQLAPFVNGMAVHTDAENNGLYGFSTIEGQYVSINNSAALPCRYVVDEHFPYFSYGMLLVKDTETNLYYYINKKGQVIGEGYLKAYPYLNRHASVQVYKDPEKAKGCVAKLIDTRQNEVQMTLNGKAVKPGTFDFISSLAGNKTAVCIHKRKIFLYENNTDDCVPFSTDNTSVKSTFVTLEEKELDLVATDDGGFSILTDNGNMFFNSNGQFVRGEWQEPSAPAPQKTVDVPTICRITSEGGMQGLSIAKIIDKSGVILPAQFEDVHALVNNLAVVRSHGKYGILRIYSMNSIQADFEQNQPFHYTNSSVEGQLVVTFPFSVSKDDIEAVASAGATPCEVQIEAGQQNYVKSGAKFTFPCTIGLPENLTVATQKFPLRLNVVYQGITSAPVETNFEADYVNPLSVVASAPVMRADSAYFHVELLSADAAIDFSDCDIDVTSSSSISVVKERIDDQHFGILVYDMEEGESPVNIIIRRKGFPPISFLYVFSYTAPVRNEGSKEKDALPATVNLTAISNTNLTETHNQ